MSKIKTLSYCRTVSIVANFNKVQDQFSASMELDEDDDPIEQSKELKRMVRKQMRESITSSISALALVCGVKEED